MYSEESGKIIALVSKLKIVDKGKSKFMKFLSWLPPLIFYRKQFLENYMTTIGPTIYWPNWDEEKGSISFRDLTVIAHETGHAYDAHKMSWFIYSLGYLFPQILALLSLLAILSIWFSNWWLLSLLCTGFLAPWPAPIRAYFEARACAAEAGVYKGVYGSYPEVQLQRRVEGIMTSWRYYKPCWSQFSGRKVMKKALQKGHPVGTQSQEIVS